MQLKQFECYEDTHSNDTTLIGPPVILVNKYYVLIIE